MAYSLVYSDRDGVQGSLASVLLLNFENVNFLRVTTTANFPKKVGYRELTEKFESGIAFLPKHLWLLRNKDPVRIYRIPPNYATGHHAVQYFIKQLLKDFFSIC